MGPFYSGKSQNSGMSTSMNIIVLQNHWGVYDLEIVCWTPPFPVQVCPFYTCKPAACLAIRVGTNTLDVNVSFDAFLYSAHFYEVGSDIVASWTLLTALSHETPQIPHSAWAEMEADGASVINQLSKTTGVLNCQWATIKLKAVFLS